MNILVVCNYDLYQNLTYSFVHSQIREYVKLGHRVRVIIPAAMGKRARNGKRFDKPLYPDEVEDYERARGEQKELILIKYGKGEISFPVTAPDLEGAKKALFGDAYPPTEEEWTKVETFISFLISSR